MRLLCLFLASAALLMGLASSFNDRQLTMAVYWVASALFYIAAATEGRD